MEKLRTLKEGHTKFFPISRTLQGHDVLSRTIQSHVYAMYQHSEQIFAWCFNTFTLWYIV